MTLGGGWGRGDEARSTTYIMVKNTWRKRLTAFTNTDNRYNHASPDIIEVVV
jgi:hypothetical protein